METLLDTIRAGYAAYDAGDEAGFRERVRGLMADDCELCGPGYDVRGGDAAAGVWLAFHRAFPDGRHEWLSAAEYDGGAAFEMRFTGTHTGPLATPDGELPATGRRVSLDVAAIVQVHGGRVTAWHDYLDTMEFARQLGMVPAGV